MFPTLSTELIDNIIALLKKRHKDKLRVVSASSREIVQKHNSKALVPFEALCDGSVDMQQLARAFPNLAELFITGGQQNTLDALPQVLQKFFGSNPDASQRLHHLELSVGVSFLALATLAALATNLRSIQLYRGKEPCLMALFPLASLKDLVVFRTGSTRASKKDELRMTEQEAQSLGMLRGLNSLELAAAMEPQHIHYISNLTRLSKLALRLVGTSGFHAFDSLSNLRSLTLSASIMPDPEDSSYCTLLAGLTKLTHLDIGNLVVAADLTPLTALASLQQLRCAQPTHIGTAALLSMTTLTHLCIHCAFEPRDEPYTEMPAELYAAARACSLRSLQTGEEGYSTQYVNLPLPRLESYMDAGLTPLASFLPGIEAMGSRLKCLSLYPADFTDDELLEAMAALPQLRLLAFTYAQQLGAKVMQALGTKSSLTHLLLHECGLLEDESTEAVAFFPLAQSSSLQHVVLVGCPSQGLTRELVGALALAPALVAVTVHTRRWEPSECCAAVVDDVLMLMRQTDMAVELVAHEEEWQLDRALKGWWEGAERECLLGE